MKIRIKLKIYYFYFMKLRLFKIVILILGTISGLYCHGKEILNNKSSYTAKKLSFSPKSLNKSKDYPFNYELILTRAANPILNTPQHRTGYSSQALNSRLSTYTISLNYLNFVCGQGNSELSHFRRLILFPFHDFW